jgi:hypothetical protein
MPLLDLHADLSFEPPAGDALTGTALGARLDADRVALRLRLDPGAWQRVLGEQLFGAHPAVLPAERAAFDAARPVTVVVDLHPALAASVLAEADPVARLSQGFSSPWDTLRQTEHWRLRTAAQAVALPEGSPAAAAEVEEGFTTAWAGGDRSMPLADAVGAAMRALGLAPVPFSETTVRARVTDDVGAWTLVVLMEPEVGLCTVYSAWPTLIAPELRPQAVDVLAQINAQLSVGSVELDEDGQLRVRTGVDLGGPAPGTRVLECTIGHNLALMREAWETFAGLAPG